MTTNCTGSTRMGNNTGCARLAEDVYPCLPMPESCVSEIRECCPVNRPCPDRDGDSQPIPDVPCNCCKVSMDEALRILCGTELAELVDFNSFFFLTKTLSIGGTLSTTVAAEGPADNINSSAASLERFSPCNCDLLEISGSAYFANPASADIALDEVDSVSMCALRAAAFQLIEGDDEEDTRTRVRRALRLLRQAIRCVGGDTGSCGRCEAHCDCDSCCCNTGLLIELSRRNISRQATLTAGPLLLRDITVLGSVGSVLVLWNETDRRVYLVCVEAIETLG